MITVCAVLEQRGEGAGAWMCAVRGMGESIRTVRTGPVQYVQYNSAEFLFPYTGN